MIMIINDYFTAWPPQKRDFSSFLKMKIFTEVEGDGIESGLSP